LGGGVLALEKNQAEHEFPIQSESAVKMAHESQPWSSTLDAPISAGESVSHPEAGDPGEVALAEPEWSFYDQLPASRWKVPVQAGVYVDPDAKARVRPAYILQAASFRNEADAQRLTEKLTQRGVQSRISVNHSQSAEPWYQVVLGPFHHQTRLNKAQDVLVSLNLMPLRKRVYPEG
jgi:cell division protein FtsN